MQAEYESRYHELEEAHWWFRGRRDMLLGLIRSMRLPREAMILDVGCSAGPLMLALRERGYGNVFGMDISATAISLAKSRGLSNVQTMDAADLRYDDAQFDLLVASDVLEHIQDESAALTSWRRVLKPGGQLIVFVPAFESLWSEHDELNLHFRRYRARGLRSVLRRAGFRIIRSGYWNLALFFPIAAVRLAARMIGRSHEASGATPQLRESSPLINGALYTLLRVENPLVRAGVPFPVGVSAFAIVTRDA